MSGSRDKSIQDKLKVFFKKGASAPLPPRNELVVSGELERELAADAPLHRRLRALRDLSERVLVARVQEGGVEKIWCLTRDLLEESSVEARHAALGLLRALAEGQADWLQAMRTVMFHYLRDTHAAHTPDDTLLRFRLLHTLTNSGKNINCFEEQIGEFLVEWVGGIQQPGLLVDFLHLITNVVKFNATYLDEHIVHAIVMHACSTCTYCPEGGGVLAALALLEAVVSYSLLPRAALPAVVAALARLVNQDAYCQTSWKLMRDVVGAPIGHAALLELVEILRGGGSRASAHLGSSQHEQAPEPSGAAEEPDAGLLRGAVFFINMALWSPRRVPTLKVSFLAVLPAFLKALEWRQAVVTYEVVAGVGMCVARAPHELSAPAWDVVLRILHVVARNQREGAHNALVHERLHALITSLEQLADAGEWGGDEDALLELVEACGSARPEASCARVVRLRAAALHHAGPAWLPAALALHERYLRLEPRRAIRLHTLHHLLDFIKRHRYVYGSELVELVAVPVLSACALDADSALRAAAARAATDLACDIPADAATDLIDLLEKILNRPFETYPAEGVAGAGQGANDSGELTLAAAGLLRVLHDKLLGAPAALPTRCFLVLLEHLDQHYKRPPPHPHPPEIRISIFDMLFGLRANRFNCVGFCYDAGGNMVSGGASLRMRPVCSPHLVVEAACVRGQGAPPPRELPAGGCVLPAGRAARLLTAALTREAEWPVLAGVLRALPTLLQARAPALGRRAQDLDLLASTLCSLISDRSLNLPEALRGAGGARVLLSELHGAALPALAALAPYHASLEPHTQQRIVRCLLKYGMVLRAPTPYIAALTIFCLETRDTMVRMLPEVLLDLSKISDTQPIAGPMLEFLSTLTRLPKVFASFVEDQYMSVFAILLPYTNPSRYNHYVVSLAHHVIAAWFLKCRLQYRRNFVRFIIHGLHNYIIMPFEEQLQYKSNFPAANEDSSNRQRSSSLGSRAVSRAPVSRGASASASAAFHVELTETCVDLLARYTSTPCSVRPTRSDTAHFLFDGGHSMTWLVGHKLVTITTSGCHQNSLKQGLCDRCAVLCRAHADSASSPLPPLAPSAPSAPPATATHYNGHALSEGGPALLGTEGESDTHLATEVKRYSKHSLQHSRSVDASSSLSCCDVLHSSSGHTSRQNSSENNKATDPLVEVLNQFSQRFERMSKEVDAEEAGWSRVGALAAAGACPCWCAAWAEVHVRSPAGDVCWLMRMQNQINWDYLLESALADVAALINPCVPPASAPAPAPLHHDTADSSVRPACSHAHAQDLHKSSSDSVVGGERRAPHAASHCILPQQQLCAGAGGGAGGARGERCTTQPINIPGSPQRQSSSSTTDDDDMLLILPEGKSRHPVRRSNSSPEMSSSWKLAASRDGDLPPEPDDMILLPSCEPTGAGAGAGGVGGAHSKKPAKKADMRVSCEAIPEEMSGTSPLQPPHHHHLLTFNSDPGTSPAPPAPAPAAPAPAPAAPAPPLEERTHHQLQKTASDGTVAGREEGRRGSRGAPSRDDLPPLARSKRSNTISVMSPTRRHRAAPSAAAPSSGSGGGGATGAGGSAAGAGGGVTPSFVFLQLYHNMSTYPITPPVPGEAASMLNPLSERPLRVLGEKHERTVKNLDLVPPVEIYKVGVLYVGPGQAEESETVILRNTHGSVRYSDFLGGLGTLVPLDGARREGLFLNLEAGGRDGAYTYVWCDDIMQVVFHVATAMPTLPDDPHCNEKRKHIGNDFVSIVYNDSGDDFNIHTIKGQLNLCIVVVEPAGHGMNRVFMKTKDERIRGEFLAHMEAHTVSDANVALLARQMALHAALASQIAVSVRGGGAPYASNSLERLRAIKRLRRRLEDERAARAARAPKPYAPQPALAMRVAIDDFNDYT